MQISQADQKKNQYTFSWVRAVLLSWMKQWIPYKPETAEQNLHMNFKFTIQIKIQSGSIWKALT